MIKKCMLVVILSLTLTGLPVSGCAGGNFESETVIVAAADSMPKFGADFMCDGRDDQVQIQAAIDTGKKVGLLKGTFFTTGEILLPSNSSIEGKGIGITRIIGSGKGTHYRIIRNSSATEGNSNIVIRNMTIDGGWSYPSAIPAGQGGALTLVKVQDAVAENVEASNGLEAIEISQSQRVLLKDVEVHHPAAADGDGISISDGHLAYGGSIGAAVSSDILIERPHIHDIYTGRAGSGIEIDDGPKLVEIRSPAFNNLGGNAIEVHVHSGEKSPERLIIRGGDIPSFTVNRGCKTRWELYNLTVRAGGATPGGYIYAGSANCSIISSNVTAVRIAVQASGLTIENSTIIGSVAQSDYWGGEGYRYVNNTFIHPGVTETASVFFLLPKGKTLSDTLITGNSFRNVPAGKWGAYFGGYNALGTVRRLRFESNSLEGKGTLWSFGGAPMGSPGTATLEDSVLQTNPPQK